MAIICEVCAITNQGRRRGDAGGGGGGTQGGLDVR